MYFFQVSIRHEVSVAVKYLEDWNVPLNHAAVTNKSISKFNIHPQNSEAAKCLAVYVRSELLLSLLFWLEPYS
jgi:hypothetical protein